MTDVLAAHAAHPVRLRVADDLERSRLTVFFRILLVIPHGIWLFLWSIAAAIAAIASWVVLLVSGSPAAALHSFLSSYIRYALHVSSYLWLVANPYPRFTGEAGVYPIDVELPPPAPQARWKTLLRVVLVLPALLLSISLGGSFAPLNSAYGRRGSRTNLGTSSGFLLGVCGFLGWFASVATGRMPKGLRDAGAYSAGYSSQLLAYLLLLTDRYPDADPWPLLIDVAAPPLHPVRLESADDLRRSRLTVLFRLPLAVPHLVWLALWGIAAVLASIPNWFATLGSGRPSPQLHRFLSAYVRYGTHVAAFLYVVGNPFPGFVGARGSYPIDLELPPPLPQGRAVTAFRVFLIVPAFLVSAATGGALLAAAILMWFAALALGTVPEGIRNLGLYALRYSAQVNAYGYLVTDRYPHASPVEGVEADAPPDA